MLDSPTRARLTQSPYDWKCTSLWRSILDWSLQCVNKPPALRGLPRYRTTGDTVVPLYSRVLGPGAGIIALPIVRPAQVRFAPETGQIALQTWSGGGVSGSDMPAG